MNLGPFPRTSRLTTQNEISPQRNGDLLFISWSISAQLWVMSVATIRAKLRNFMFLVFACVLVRGNLTPEEIVRENQEIEFIHLKKEALIYTQSVAG